MFKKLFKSTIIRIKKEDKEKSIELLKKNGIHVYNDMYFVPNLKNIIIGFFIGAILVMIFA